MLRQLWGSGMRVLPVLTKTDLLDQVIVSIAKVSGPSHLVIAIVSYPARPGQQSEHSHSKYSPAICQHLI